MNSSWLNVRLIEEFVCVIWFGFVRGIESVFRAWLGHEKLLEMKEKWTEKL